MLLTYEQVIINFTRLKYGKTADVRDAMKEFNPQKPENQKLIKEAERLLNQNFPGWQKLF